MSLQLYEKYTAIINRKVEITLKDNTSIIGMLIGYFKQDDDATEIHINSWHVVDEHDEETIEIDTFGSFVGTVIKQNKIAEIYFFEDDTSMRFKWKENHRLICHFLFPLDRSFASVAHIFLSSA